RRVQRERPLDADAERVLAHGEGFPDAGALALDHDPLEHLDPLAVPLDDLEMHTDRVSGFEPRHFAQLLALELLNDHAHRKAPRGAFVMVPASIKAERRSTGSRS